MRALAVLLSAAAMLAAVGMAGAAAPREQPRTFHNPIIYADYSDPDVIRVDRDYYLVASSFHFSPGIPVLKSRDLVHWSIAAHVLARLPFHPAYDIGLPYSLTDSISKPVGPGLRYAGGVWAPSIRQHDGRFYVYWATPDEGIFMSMAAHPEGPWSAPVTVLPGPGYEDPCPFWDDDGKAYLVHSRVGAGPIILHAMKPDGTALLDAGKTIIEDKLALPVLEGPKVYKRNGYYYIFAPFGGVETGGQAVMRARSVDGPYEHRVVLTPGNGLNGPHQGGWVDTPSGQGWFVHFNSTGAFGRITYLQPVTWKDDWPEMGQAGMPVSTAAYPDSGALSRDRLQDSDEFSSGRLGLQWSWNHNPDDARWSLTQRRGFMRLGAARARHLVGARNTLTQILQGPATDIATRLDIGALGEGQRAGLVLFGVRAPWIGVVRENGVNFITYAEGGQETRGAALAGASIVLRAQVRADQTVQFSYALHARGPFVALGPVTRLARFSWWKGSRPGLFTYIKADDDEAKQAGAAGRIVENFVDVDWFRVSRR